MNDQIKEYLLYIGIALCLGYVVLVPEKDTKSKVKPPTMESFDEFPLVAWAAYDSKGGPCVRVRYEVKRKNTRLYMLDEKGHMVHKTPLSFSPLPDGRERIETYVWKLHRTEWTPEIFPGTYTIVVGTDYDRRGLTEEVIIE